MRISKYSALSICVLAALFAAGCATTNGSGTIKTESRTITGVSSVYLLGDAEIEIVQSATESLSVTADDNILPLLRTEVHDGELKLDVKNLQNVEPTKRILYKLTVKGLTGLSLAGDATATVQKIATDRLKVSITGDATVRIDGTADNQDIMIMGDGKYEGASLTSKTANVSITGDGNLDLAVSDKLDIKIFGDGKINYTGDPTVTKTVVGDGRIEKKS